MTRRLLLAALPQAMSYLDQSAHWRRQREADLKADGGWLTVTGLHWLEQGKPRTIAAHAFLLSNTRKTELPSAATIGVFPASLGARTAPFALLSNGVVSADGKPLKPDTDLITSGTKTLFVIERGGRFAIRERDTLSPYRKQFRGLEWFPVKEDYRIQARFLPHSAPKTMSIPTVIEGVTEQMISPGVVEFTLRGTKCRLAPVISGNQLFFIS